MGSEHEQGSTGYDLNDLSYILIKNMIKNDDDDQVIGELFKDNLDLLYSAHNDTFKKHRALHILNPDHRFSGTYMCKVTATSASSSSSSSSASSSSPGTYMCKVTSATSATPLSSSS